MQATKKGTSQGEKTIKIKVERNRDNVRSWKSTTQPTKCFMNFNLYPWRNLWRQYTHKAKLAFMENDH